MKKLYRYRWDWEESIDLKSLFIEDEETVKKLIGSDLFFSVVNDSCVDYYVIDSDKLEIISDDPKVVEALLSVFEHGYISGYNPFEYAHKDCCKCGDSFNISATTEREGKWICIHCDGEENE